MSTAIIFPGQGSQGAGMVQPYMEHPATPVIFGVASEILGYDLLEACNDESLLATTRVAQPAIMAVSLAAYESAISSGAGEEAVAVAGHSLGEYAALVTSGALSLEDGFKLIKIRGEAMQKAAESAPGGMSAIMRLAATDVEAICREVCPDPDAPSIPADYVVPANYNGAAQTVISGHISGIEKAEALAVARGGKAVRLGVASGFHSRLMSGAAAEFLTAAKTVIFSKPQVAFYSNVTGGPIDFSASNPAELFARHIQSPVRFTEELLSMSAGGCTNFIECGPGKALSTMGKRLLENASFTKV